MGIPSPNRLKDPNLIIRALALFSFGSVCASVVGGLLYELAGYKSLSGRGVVTMHRVRIAPDRIRCARKSYQFLYLRR